MNQGNTHPAAPSDADLLAWVEGVPLPGDRESAVLRALARDPAFAARLERMREDCLCLRRLPEVAPPAALLDAVAATLEPMLERQVLLGLEEGEPVAQSPPVSIVRPARRRLVQTFFAEKAGRRFAAAAAVLLAAGAAAYFAAPRIGAAPAPRLGPIAALNHTDRAERTEEFPQREAVAMLAEKPAPAAEQVATSAAPIDAFADAAGESPAQPAGIDAALAVQLAGERRLAIRVRGGDPSLVAARLDTLAERVARPSSGVRSWRLSQEVPAEMALALNRPASLPLVRRLEPEPAPMLADSRAGPPTPRVRVQAPRTPRVPAPAQPDGLFRLDVRLDAPVLEAVLVSLCDSREQTAEFEELAEPLPEPALPLHPAAVLWWSRAAPDWAKWTSLPVIVERER